MTFEPRLIKAICLCNFCADSHKTTEKLVKKCYEIDKHLSSNAFS